MKKLDMSIFHYYWNRHTLAEQPYDSKLIQGGPLKSQILSIFCEDTGHLPTSLLLTQLYIGWSKAKCLSVCLNYEFTQPFSFYTLGHKLSFDNMALCVCNIYHTWHIYLLKFMRETWALKAKTLSICLLMIELLLKKENLNSDAVNYRLRPT